jgi:hypothetical protein
MKTRLLLFILFAFSFVNAQIYVTESFESNFPVGWTTTGATYPAERVSEPSYSCGGNFSMASTCNPSNPWVMIVTPSYVSNGNEINVNFQYRPKYSFGGTARIYYELNNSGTWNQIAALATSSTSCNYVSSSIANGAVTSGTSVKFRFQLNYQAGATNALVYIDNVNISQATLSISDFTQNNLEVAIYPNPVNDILNIDTKEEVLSVEVFALQGQKVMSSKENKINVSELPAGIYLVRIQDVNNNIATKKIIKN